MEDIGVGVYGGEDGVAIDYDLHCGLFLAVEPKLDLIQPVRTDNDCCGILLPHKILGQGVNNLPLPRHQIPIFQPPTIPHPPTHNILRAQRLINGRLVLYKLQHPFLLNHRFQFLREVTHNQLQIR